MKIAITSTGNTSDSKIDPRFGRAKFFMVYDDEKDSYEAIDNVQNVQAAHGAGPQATQSVADAGCGALITGHVGPNAFNALKMAKIEVFTVESGTVREAVDAYKAGKLKAVDSADVEGGWV